MKTRSTDNTWLLSGVVLICAAAFSSSCQDEGTVTPPSKTNGAGAPVITSLAPDSAAAGDTLLITGRNFGETRGTSQVRFGTTPLPDSVYDDWNATSIRVRVPGFGDGAFSVTVLVGTSQSNAVGFRMGSVQRIAFATEVLPIFLANCAISGCHTGPTPPHGFNASTYSGLRAGGSTFGTSAVVAFDSTSSGVMKMIRSSNNPIGVRMPLAGTYASTGLPDSLIVRIGTWIQQGADDK